MEPEADFRGTAPKVSVLMANLDGARHLAEAVASVLGQTVTDLELIVADDGSTDASLGLLAGLAAADARLRVLSGGARRGPGAARNRALLAARGEWVAVVDADDVILPDRLSRLIGAAEAAGADAVADDLAFFGDPESEGRTLLGPGPGAPRALDPAEFLRGHIERYRRPNYGYLKPVIRRAALAGLAYDENLRIGEDSDLLLRLLLAGRRLWLLPAPLYRYRRHAGSMTNRWNVAEVAALAEHQRELLAEVRPAPEVRHLMQERLGELERRLAFEEVVEALKARAPRRALGRIARRPGLLGLLSRAAAEGLWRRLGPRDA